MKTRIRQLTEQERRSLGEQQMIADWLRIFPKGILSIVADTFDLWKLITEYLPANKEAIMARDGKLVIRPDSGDPVDIICGTEKSIVYNDNIDVTQRLNWTKVDLGNGFPAKWLVCKGKVYGISTNTNSVSDVKFIETNFKPEQKGVIELLWDIFGGTINEQGYKVLDPHIGAIYGDSITPDRQREIYERLAAKGFASTNIVLGVGSFTYQYITRDTLGFAAKGAWFEVYKQPCTKETGCLECKSIGEDIDICKDGCVQAITKSYNIYKDPVTDDGTKKSLKGLLSVIQSTTRDISFGEYGVKQECTPEEENQGLLQVIYEEGKFYNQTTFKEVRDRLSKI